MAAPVEAKVKAGSAAAAVSGAVLWLLGRYLFHGAVPDVFVGLVDVGVPAAGAFVGGWCARHTYRPPVPHLEVVPSDRST